MTTHLGGVPITCKAAELLSEYKKRTILLKEREKTGKREIKKRRKLEVKEIRVVRLFSPGEIAHHAGLSLLNLDI